MAVLRSQPQGLVVIDWSNPITQGMTFAYSHTPSGPTGYSTGFGQNSLNYLSGTTVIGSPLGIGIRSNSSSNKAYQIGGHGLTSQSYSLFAVCTAASNAVTQNVLDMDNSSPRYFQFQLSNGKSQIIPFNTSAGTTGIAATTGLSVAELNRGFTMGAAVSPSRVAAFQNMQVATATPASLITVSGTFPITVGSRATGVQGWTSGGISMVAGWNRALSDAEMYSLAQNPWQLFRGANDEDLDFFSLSGTTGASYSYTGSGGLNTSGQGVLQRIRNAISVGGVSMGGQATSSSLISRIVTASGGFVLSSAAAVSKQTSRTTNAFLAMLGGASVISQIAGQPIVEVFGALNDIMMQKLRALGNVGALRDMLNDNKYWRALSGNSNKPINDVKKEYLKSQGLTGHVNEMEKQYWKNK